MRLSITNKLKKQLHKDQGYLQDELITSLYQVLPDLILHGGTTIWRCYGGNRYSEDLDFYLIEQDGIQIKIKQTLEKINLNLIKYKQTDNVIFAKASNNIDVRIEIRLLKKKDPILSKKVVREYERMDGGIISIYTLSVEDLLLEKANAYINRKLIRDIYDVYYLSYFISDNKEYRKQVIELINKFPLSAVDESTFKSIILTGVTPTTKQMLDSLKKKLINKIKINFEIPTIN